MLDEPDRERLIGVCAWCHRLRGPQGVWVDLGHYEPPEDGVEVTHTACPTCFEKSLAELPSGLL